MATTVVKRLHGRLDLRLLRHIHRVRPGCAALRLNSLAGGFSRLAIVIEHRHLGARQSQRQGHPLANAIAPAGHHRGLAMKIKHMRRLK